MSTKCRLLRDFDGIRECFATYCIARDTVLPDEMQPYARRGRLEAEGLLSIVNVLSVQKLPATYRPIDY